MNSFNDKSCFKDASNHQLLSQVEILEQQSNRLMYATHQAFIVVMTHPVVNVLIQIQNVILRLTALTNQMS